MLARLVSGDIDPGRLYYCFVLMIALLKMMVDGVFRYASVPHGDFHQPASASGKKDHVVL